MNNQELIERARKLAEDVPHALTAGCVSPVGDGVADDTAALQVIANYMGTISTAAQLADALESALADNEKLRTALKSAVLIIERSTTDSWVSASLRAALGAQEAGQ